MFEKRKLGKGKTGKRKLGKRKTGKRKLEGVVRLAQTMIFRICCFHVSDFQNFSFSGQPFLWFEEVVVEVGFGGAGFGVPVVVPADEGGEGHENGLGAAFGL